SGLMEEEPWNSMFIITKADKIDKDKCQREVEKWAKKIFPELPKEDLPEGLLKRIVEVQPMNDEANVWLWAIHSLNNLKSHNLSKFEVGETFTIKMAGKPDLILQTEDIVKESCEGVMDLVVDLIQMCVIDRIRAEE
ncbi:hypothetical protein BSL78_28618, partial [Apostichopus japonicus]